MFAYININVNIFHDLILGTCYILAERAALFSKLKFKMCLGSNLSK